MLSKRFVLIALVLVGCGDNTAPSVEQPPATSQSVESTVVPTGTYQLIVERDLVAWRLSSPGEVYIPLRSTTRGAVIERVRLCATATAEPTIAMIDQVDSERVILGTHVEGAITLGLATYVLDESLQPNSDGEMIWLRVTAALGSPVDIYSLTWGAKEPPLDIGNPSMTPPPPSSE